jgi:hypothetical protein
MRLLLSVPVWFQGVLKNVFGPAGGSAPPVQNGFFGNQTTGGGGNWGLQADRAMGNIATNAHTATLKKGFLYIIPGSGSGSSTIKMCVYSNNAGVPNAPLAVSAPTTVSAAGWAEFNFADEVVAPGQVHIIAVSGSVGGAGWDMGSFDSGGLPAAMIFNNTFSYTSPPNPCPAPDTQYNNGLAAYVTYTY